jgi:hypothetical protein
LLMVLVVTAASASAFAHGGAGRGHSGGRHASGGQSSGHHFGGARLRLGVIVAAPAFWYSPPLSYYPPLAVAPSAPPVYIEQGSAIYAPDRPAGYWYYCAEAQAYYPYVKECAGNWQPVAPQAPPGQ